MSDKPNLIQPMLAYNGEWSADQLTYPVAVTPKLDGVRCFKQYGKPYSRDHKSITNRMIHYAIKDHIPDFTDGEIIMPGKSFHEIQSIVTTRDACPGDFVFYAFDHLPKGRDSLSMGYVERICSLQDRELSFNRIVLDTIDPKDKQNPSIRNVIASIRLKILAPKPVADKETLLAIHQQLIDAGYEGTMVRSFDGPYKEGRSTLNEGYMLKLVNWLTDEAVIIGFNEEMKSLDTRTSFKQHLVANNSLGSLRVKHPKYGEFNIGSGFDKDLRKAIWKDRASYLTKKVTFKHKGFGGKDKPRSPIFVGIRHD